MTNIFDVLVQLKNLLEIDYTDQVVKILRRSLCWWTDRQTDARTVKLIYTVGYVRSYQMKGLVNLAPNSKI